MTVYERRTRVEAPLEDVWAFQSGIDGLVALTPDWLCLEVEGVVGPDGERDPEALEEGAEVHLSVRPFGVAPRQRWTSVVEERAADLEEGWAVFRDEMRDGPFEKWVHTHRFYADGDDTVVDDRVEYELPGGGLGRALGPAAYVGFEPMFAHRHRETRRRLER